MKQTMAACRVLDEPIRLTVLDGQTGVEDVWDDGTDTLVTRYGIGARGIEMISKIENGGSETFGFPVYDTHGNMVATLGRSGSSFTLGNEQSYDVWGSVRSGSSSEQQGYVANLGHRADPESFLTYMRARYYEPMTGRFISEDPAHDGHNYYAYARNIPTSFTDSSGRAVAAVVVSVLILLWIYLSYFATDSNQVEGAYGLALETMEKDLSDFLGIPNWMQEASDGIRWGWQASVITRAAIAYAIVGTASNAYALGVALGVAVRLLYMEFFRQLPLLFGIACAYTMRVAWYIDDIDR